MVISKEELERFTLPPTIIVDEDLKQKKYCLDHTTLSLQGTAPHDIPKKLYVYAYRDENERIAWVNGESYKLRLFTSGDTRDEALNRMKKLMLEYKKALKKAGNIFND